MPARTTPARKAPAKKTKALTAPPSLDSLQRWFQDAIVAGSEVPGRRAPDDREVDSRITRSASLTARERLDVYAHAYFARLHDALVADYPAVRHVLGNETFYQVARRYLTAHPSRHPSLNELGRDFPGFLESSAGRIPRRALVHDVARVERSMAVVFDAAEAVGMTPADFAAFPREQFGEAVFHFVPAFELLALDHNANAIASCVRQDKPLPSLGRRETWVAVYRKDDVVWRKDLDAIEFRLLSDLLGGMPLAQALDACAAAFPQADLAPRVGQILGDWPNEGVIARLSVPRKARRTR